MTGEELKRKRERADLSQAELGRRIGRSTLTVSAWECGRRDVPPQPLPAIQQALDGRLTAAPPPLKRRELERLLKRSGLTQSALAAAVGVERQAISVWKAQGGVPGLWAVAVREALAKAAATKGSA